MDLDEMVDEQIKKLIDKADQIFENQLNKETLTKERQDQITIAREEEGRINIRIQQLKRKKQSKETSLQAAHLLYEGHKEYFDLIWTYRGDVLIEKLHERFSEDEIRNIYWKALDSYNSLVGRKSPKELREEIDSIDIEIFELERQRRKLRKDISSKLSDIEIDLELLS